MAVSLTTTRYVKALFAVADQRGEREQVRDELTQLGGLFEQSADLVAALHNPQLASDAKKRVLDAAGVDTAAQTVRDFVAYCLDRGRAEVVLEAPEEFERLDREARGIVQATVETARPLSDELRGSIQAKLEEVTAKTVEMREETVPELLGGIRVLIGSKMYDGSVRRQLDELTAHLQSTQIG